MQPKLKQAYQLIARGARGTLVFLILVALVGPFLQVARVQAAPPILQEFYVPLSEAGIWNAMRIVLDDPIPFEPPLHSALSIVATGDHTVIYYDHWEDGYENALYAPTQSTTLVFGDGNPHNGDASDVCSRCSGDVVNAGAVLVLRSDIEIPRDASKIRYDAKDRIGATRGIILTRSEWPQMPGGAVAGAAPFYDTTQYGQAFDVPVGENLADTSLDVFEYAEIHVQAQENGTSCQLTRHQGGTTGFAINQGEIHVQPHVQAGDRLICNKKVQVHLITGDVNSGVAMRWFVLFPTVSWSHDYYAPVGTPSDENFAAVWLYNPNDTSITVHYESLNGSSAVEVPSRQALSVIMPEGSGAHFYTDGLPFAAVGVMDQPIPNQTPRPGEKPGMGYDWGYSLMPAGRLSSSATVGFGVGSISDPLTEDYNPVWAMLTHTSGTARLYVDYDGDPTTGPKIDPNGQHYNVHYDLAPYQFVKIYDTDNDQTGMHLYTVDKQIHIAAAWGEDPTTAVYNLPALDVGTEVFSSPYALLDKSARVVNDLDGDGEADPGETLEYEITVHNFGGTSLYDVNILDSIPEHTTYVPGSTVVNGNPLPDDASPHTPFPLDESGYTHTAIPAGGQVAVTFQVKLDLFPPPYDAVRNVAFAEGQSAIVVTNVPSVDLAVTKDDGVIDYSPGRDLTYKIVVENKGPSDAMNAVVTDIQPPQINRWTWICASTTGGASGCDGVTDSLDDFRDEVNLPANSSITYIVKAHVNDNATGRLENTVRVDPPPTKVERDLTNNVDNDVDVYNPYLPGTGFTPGKVTLLPPQTVRYEALKSAMRLEIPKLGVSIPVVGVPQEGQGWNLTWLADNAGWLEGTAYPTWEGNTVLTGHVYLANGQPGPFARLSSLRWGDQIILHAHGQRYVYEVRVVKRVHPWDTSVLGHKNRDWLTLLTCAGYNEQTHSYRWRVAVQAVLMQVEADR